MKTTDPFVLSPCQVIGHGLVRVADLAIVIGLVVTDHALERVKSPPLGTACRAAALAYLIAWSIPAEVGVCMQHVCSSRS